jgi:hypothetical protein
MVAQSSLDLILRQSVEMDITKGPTEEQAIRLVGKIWQDDPETKAWLYCLAETSDNPISAFSSLNELIRISRRNNGVDMLYAIRSLAQSSRQRMIRIIAIRLLVEHFDRDYKTLAIIKELAKSDPHKDVRSEARDALVLGWKEDPAIQVFLDGL